MVSLAKENLLHEKSKIILSMGGVVLAVFLIFATVGLYYGINTVVENMVLKAGADLWVTSKGSSGSLHSPSLLSTQVGEELKSIEGINATSQLGAFYTLFKFNIYWVNVEALPCKVNED